MKSAAILAAGIAALGLLAALCLPRHVPPSTALGPAIPANFHARVEYGMLILRGSLPSETSKTAILQRAQELYGATPGHVVDELAVDPRVGPVAWADNVSQVLPVLGHMTERGSIIIDGRTIVVSGQVGDNRAKASRATSYCPSDTDRAGTGRSYSGRFIHGGPPHEGFFSNNSIPESSISKDSRTGGIPIPECAFYHGTIPEGSLSEDVFPVGSRSLKGSLARCSIPEDSLLGGGPSPKDSISAGNSISD